MIDIHLHVFQPPPLIESITFMTWSRHTCNKYFGFHLRTVTLSQTDLVLHPRMEGEQSTNNINATYMCLTTLDYPGFRVNLFLNSYKMPVSK